MTMKKILLFSLALMTVMSFYSCKDDDNKGGSAADATRLFRPMFRTDNNTGKGSTDPYNSVVVDRNNIVVVDNGSANLFNINTSDAAANFNRLPAVRYMLPYPEEAIARSNGVYKNYYGY